MWKFPARKITAYFGYNTSDFNGIQANVYVPISIVVMRSEDIAILITGQYLACSNYSSTVKSKVGRQQEELENDNYWLDGKTKQKLAPREVHAELSVSQAVVEKLLSPQSQEKIQLKPPWMIE